MVTEQIRQKSTLDPQSEDIVKKELMAAFTKHVEGIIELMIRRQERELRKALDAAGEGSDMEYAEKLIESLAEIKAKYDHSSESELAPLALAVLNVRQRQGKCVDPAAAGPAQLHRGKVLHADRRAGRGIGTP